MARKRKSGPATKSTKSSQSSTNATNPNPNSNSQMNRSSPLSNPATDPSASVEGTIPVLHLEAILEDGEDEHGEEPWRIVSHSKSRRGPDVGVPVPEPVEGSILQLEDADVVEEISYWSTALYGFVLGANPPLEVIKGFLNRIWKTRGMASVSFLPNGIFVVRFTTLAQRDLVLNDGPILFDNKPVILKPWCPDVNITKEDVKVVPIWVKLRKLDLKIWGNGCLAKIAGLIGKHVKNDGATNEKSRLGFARVMVEVKIGQPLPDVVQFLDEKKTMVVVPVEYEWKPVLCANCKGFGHDAAVCRRSKGAPPVTRKVWRPVQRTVPDANAVNVSEVASAVEENIAVGQEISENQEVSVINLFSTPHPCPGPIFGNVATPAHIVTKVNRQDIIAHGSVSGPLTFLDALNSSFKGGG